MGVGRRLAGAAVAVASAILFSVPALRDAQAQARLTPTPPPQAAQPGPAPLPTRPAALKSFQRSDLVDAARRYERTLKREAQPLTKPAAQVRRDADAALQRNDARTAATLYAALAAANPNDSAVWVRLSRALLMIRPQEGEDRYTFSDQALGAAFMAYRKATSRAEEGEALSYVGHIYAERSLWRAAIETMKVSLDLRDNAQERAFYDKLKAEHGFRMLDYTVESDLAAPRACVQFSEDLDPAVSDFSSFVQVEGQDKPAVSATGRQICVEGLKHGERYILKMRAGVPSAVGEKLAKPVELSIYVRDRAPSAHFTGRNYVLPRTGQKGIPIVTVNTAEVQIRVLRIGDRSLVPTALQGQFRNNLESFARVEMSASTAVEVFRGKLDVESPLNADVTTAVPVNEALGTLSPGLYVLSARPSDGTQDEFGQEEATQWFIVSDLGLTALSGSDGVHVLVRGLGDAQPMAKVKVRLIARSNEVLGTADTDAQGHVRFDAGLSRGKGGLAPEAVVAETAGGDYAFLSLRESAFDLTDRGVAGREAPGPLEVFLATERGVYRSGESVHATALLRDAQGKAGGNVPLTFILYRPDGVESRRITSAEASAGGRTLDLPILAGAQTGTWRLKAYTDPKADPIGEVAFLVEDYLPDRIEFDLKPRVAVLSRTAPAELAIDGRYLYGAPAAGLNVEAETELRLADGRKAFPGFKFGNVDDQVLARRDPVADTPRTDARGRASLSITTSELPATSRPLEVEAFVRLVEPGGRAVQRSFTLPVAAGETQIGVKPLFADALPEGAQATFDVIVADPDDKSVARSGLKWELTRIETRFQWYKVSGSWDYEPVKTVRRIAEGRFDVAADTPARLAMPTEYGDYRLTVTGEGLPATSLTFVSGYGGAASADTPDRLDLTLPRAAFATGDTLDATITARMAGTATVLVINGAVLESRVVQVAPGANKVSFKVGEGWGPGAYVVAFLHRPLDVQAGRMPGRSIGLAWFSVDKAERTLKVEMAPPAEIRPGTDLVVPLTVSGLKPGEAAYVTLAVVDVGILNLTRYQPPAPEEVVFGQRRLSPEIRDLYGALIDGMQGNAGRLRSGGDESGGGMSGSPPAQAPLALFSGIVAVGPDGKAQVSFPIPAFDGTARLMAIAWSADKLGHGVSDVVIRDKVVILSTLPRFLAAGDRSSLHLDIANVAGPAGEYALKVQATGAAQVGAAPATLTLAAGERRGLDLPLEGKGMGEAQVTVSLAGQGIDVARQVALAVRPAYPAIERRTVRTLAPGEGLTLTPDLFADLLPGTGSVALSVTPNSTLDVPALLSALDRYPYGCSEQVTSQAYPLLYVSDLAPLVSGMASDDPQKRLTDAVTRLSARQGSDGSFGLWSAGGGDTWLDAYVTDFLSRAREKGVAVPQRVLDLALDRLRNVVNLATGNAQQTDEGLAYALYVLARNGRAPLGDLRYVADARLKDIATPLAKGQVGAALALLGDRTRAERVFAVALQGVPSEATTPQFGRADFGSVLRDAAALSVLAREAGLQSVAQTALDRMEVARTRTERTSTQENAWLILAARMLAGSAGAMALEVNGAPHQGPLGRRLSRADLAAAPVTVRNAGKEPVRIVVSIDGPPAAPEPAISKGFSLTRAYFTMDGKPADPTKAAQNQRFVVVLRAEEAQASLADVLLVDYLPAGFQIENPRLIEGGEDGGFAWLGDVSEIVHSEFRDDRFVASTTRHEGDDPLVAAYVVRAVSPGRYAHPPATIEDMYRPDRFARTGAGTMEVAPSR